MKNTLEHLPQTKQRELAQIVAILHEEFADAVRSGTAEFKKKGRILKIILFGSYARGDWVDEPHTMKGYRSDYDLLIVVNNRKLTEFSRYWATAKDVILREKSIGTPTSFLVYSRREVNNAIRSGHYFYTDIRREGIVLYELDEEPLAEPRALSSIDRIKLAEGQYSERFPASEEFISLFDYAKQRGWQKRGAFLLHQAIEALYSTLLLTRTNYSPPSHNLQFLRSLAEDQDRRLAEIWPRDQRRYVAWFNTLNEAYVKARYSRHYEITGEALAWLGDQTRKLHDLVEQICVEHLEKLRREAEI